MKWSSALLTEGRNKLGGTVWSRNTAGNYIRARVKPRNPQTTSQQANRETFAYLTQSFKTLTQTQIAAWNAAGLTVDLQDALGNTIHPSGIQLYVSCNMHLTYAAQSLITDPAADLSPPPAPTISAVTQTLAGAVNIVWNFTAALPGSTSGLFLIGYATQSFSPGVNFIAPFMYRFSSYLSSLGSELWDLYTGPDYGQPIYQNGQKAAWKLRTISATSGMASIPTAYSAILTAL